VIIIKSVQEVTVECAALIEHSGLKAQEVPAVIVNLMLGFSAQTGVPIADVTQFCSNAANNAKGADDVS